MKTLIIGGVAGGMSAATRLRRLNEDMDIVIFEKGDYVSFANCGLPYYVAGEIVDRSNLLVQTPEALKSRFNLDVRVNSEVVAIDPDKKEVTVLVDGKEYTESYDNLIMSPGAKPFVPNLPGLEEAKDVFTLRNINDVDNIMNTIEVKNPKRAVVIGAGFIGLEMVESLANRGLEVTVIESAPHVLPTVDEDMASFIAKELRANNVDLYTNDTVVGFSKEGKTVELASGKVIDTDMIILSVGVRPESDLAKDSGIELGMRGGIVVDENYETNKKGVYAVGDAIIVNNQITNQDTMIALASPANRQGRQVADVISGLPRKNRGSIGTAIVRVFDQVIASTGLSARMAKDLGLTYKIVHVEGKNHAGYYPNASMIFTKLIFNPETGEIYGAQAVGVDGVDKRIDVLATAIKGNLTVDDLPELELTYAPPFGSAKDVVNMLGYAAMNLKEGLTDSIQISELAAERDKGSILIDVRSAEEFNRGGIEGFINMPLNDLRESSSTLPKDKTLILSCHSGQRSYIAQRMLTQMGYSVKTLDGAYLLYDVLNQLN